MTNDDKPEGAPERSAKADAGAPSGVDGNGPKRFSVQRKMAIVARLLRGEPLELVARVSVRGQHHGQVAMMLSVATIPTEQRQHRAYRCAGDSPMCVCCGPRPELVSLLSSPRRPRQLLATR
jgi:hypothetical protein